MHNINIEYKHKVLDISFALFDWKAVSENKYFFIESAKTTA